MMPFLHRRKSRPALPTSSPPLTSSPLAQQLPIPATNDFSLPYVALRSSSDLVPGHGTEEMARAPSRAKVHGAGALQAGGQLAKTGFHTPYAYSPPRASLAPQAVGWGALPRSPSAPAWTPSPSPPFPPPQTGLPPLPPGPANVNYAVSRRSIASFYPSPNLAPAPSEPLPPPPFSSSTTVAKSPSSPAALSTSATTAQSPVPTQRSRLSASIRRPRRAAPSYNILLVGAKRTGKTGFASALREVLPLAPGGRGEEVADEAVGVRRTTFDVLDAGERISLSILDTPGLDIPLFPTSPLSEAEHVLLDQRLGDLTRFVEARLEQTLLAENEVHRTPGGGVQDPHIHLCLYFVHPEAMLQGRGGWRMGEADLLAMKRLSERVNIVPVIARADTLTIHALSLAKRGMLNSLSTSSPTSTNLLTTFFGTSYTSSSDSTASTPLPASPISPTRPFLDVDNQQDGGGRDSPEVVHLRQSRPVSRAPSRALSHRARRRRTLTATTASGEESEEAEGELVGERFGDEELRSRWPFALVSPHWDALDAPSEVKGQVKRERGKGLVREYRHGCVDVLNPDHCDFLPLVQLLFGDRMERFKSLTRLEFYEPFRTSRLLSLQQARTPSRRITMPYNPSPAAALPRVSTPHSALQPHLPQAPLPPLQPVPSAPHEGNGHASTGSNGHLRAQSQVRRTTEA
ncbi:hypothetical protein JCM11641_005396 [Rhodosporidiobolus odoratus]